MDIYLKSHPTDLSPHNPGIQLEAEKLIRWKINKELEVQEKERTLNRTSGVAQVQSEQIMKLKRTNDQLGTEIQAALRSCEEQKEKTLHTKADVETLNSQIGLLQSTILKTKTSQNHLKDVLEKKQMFLNQLVSKLDMLQLSAKKQVKDVTDYCIIQEEKILKEVEILQDRIKELELQLEKLEGERESACKLLAEKETNHASVSEKIQHCETEINGLKEEITRLSSEKDEAVTNLTAKHEGLELKVKKLNTDISSINEKCALLSYDNEEKDAILDKLEQDLKLVAEEEEARKHELSELNLEHEEILAKLSQNREVMAAQKTVMETLLKKEKELINLKSDHKRMSDDLEVCASRSRSLEEEVCVLAKAQKQKISLHQEVLELHAQILELEKKDSNTVEFYNLKMTMAEQNLADVKQELERAQHYEQKMKTERDLSLSQLEQDLEKEVVTLSKLKNEISAKEIDTNRLELELENVKQQLGLIISDLKVSSSENEKYALDIDEQESKIIELRKNLILIKETVERDSENYRTVEANVEALLADKAELANMLKDKDLKLKELDDEISRVEMNKNSNLESIEEQIKVAELKLASSEKQEELGIGQLKEIEAMMSSITNELNMELTKAKEIEDEKLNSESICLSLRSSIDEIGTEKDVENTIKNVQDNISQAKADSDRIKKDIDSLGEKIADAKDQKEKRLLWIKRDNKETINDWLEGIRNMEEKIKTQEAKIENYKSEMSKEKSEHSLLVEKLHKIKEELVAVKNKEDYTGSNFQEERSDGVIDTKVGATNNFLTPSQKERNTVIGDSSENSKRKHPITQDEDTDVFTSPLNVRRITPRSYRKNATKRFLLGSPTRENKSQDSRAEKEVLVQKSPSFKEPKNQNLKAKTSSGFQVYNFTSSDDE